MTWKVRAALFYYLKKKEEENFVESARLLVCYLLHGKRDSFQKPFHDYAQYLDQKSAVSPA